jgi:cell pole-organizing protein PopZ
VGARDAFDVGWNMNQMDAGDELSMEDILASIRQIIAEEPKVVAPPSPPVQALPQTQPTQAPVPQPTVAVTTVGLPQGYSIPRPDASIARNGGSQGVPLPSFAEQRMRAPAPAPLAPRSSEVAAQQPVQPSSPAGVNFGTGAAGLNGAPTGTLASRLNDVFGAGPALRLPENGRPAPQYGAQTVKSALDADLADLMVDEAPSAPEQPSPSSMPPVTAQPVSVNPRQTVVAPPVAEAFVARPALLAEPQRVAASPVVQPPLEVNSPPMTSVMPSPHPLPSWLNRAPDAAPEFVATPRVEPIAPLVAPVAPPAPAVRGEPLVEAAVVSKVKPGPVVIAAMVSAPKAVPVVPVASVAVVAPPVVVAPVVGAVEPLEVSAPTVPSPALSMADVLPSSDVSMAWVPAARAEAESVSADRTAPTPIAVAEAAVSPASASGVEPHVDAAVASALGALAAGLAASRVTVAPEIVVSAKAAPSAPVVEAAPVAGLQAAITDTAAQPLAGSNALASQDARSEGVALEPVYPHDDTAVELLRPMLRHWLDSNMPRIVEKALRAELAVNPPGSKPNSDG